MSSFLAKTTNFLQTLTSKNLIMRSLRSQMRPFEAIPGQSRTRTSPAVPSLISTFGYRKTPLASSSSSPPLGSSYTRRVRASSSSSSAPIAAAAVTATPAAAPPALPKNFDPLESEQRLYSWWEASGFFKPDDAATGEPFVISMPPPNVTGKLHMGHAMFVTLQDIMARFNRMRGRPTLWLPGTDHAGIATQMVVEKMLAAQGKDRRSMGREAFEKEVWSWKAEYGGFITQQLRRMGASCDWSRERFTLDAGLSGKRKNSVLKN